MTDFIYDLFFAIFWALQIIAWFHRDFECKIHIEYYFLSNYIFFFSIFYIKLMQKCIPNRLDTFFQKIQTILLIFAFTFYFFWNLLGIYWTTIIALDSSQIPKCLSGYDIFGLYSFQVFVVIIYSVIIYIIFLTIKENNQLKKTIEESKKNLDKFYNNNAYAKTLDIQNFLQQNDILLKVPLLENEIDILESQCTTNNKLDNFCCVICQENVQENEELTTIGCTHKFHKDCIQDWLKIKPTCPMCKYNVRNYLMQIHLNKINDEQQQVQFL